MSIEEAVELFRESVLPARRKGADERDEATADSYGFIVASEAGSFGVAGRAGVPALVRPSISCLLPIRAELASDLKTQGSR